MSRLKKILEIRKQLRELGDYDTSIAGAVGEVYAEEVLGMVKAPRGEKAIDGYINGRSVQIKTKDGMPRTDSAMYAGVRLGREAFIEDLLVVMIDGDSVTHLGPVPLKDLPYTENKTERRHYINKIKQYLATKEIE